MSHVYKGEIEIDESQILGGDLAAAIKPFDGEVLHKNTHVWYGAWMGDTRNDPDSASRMIDPKNFGKCDYALRFKGIRYEIGLIKQANGKYMAVHDGFGFDDPRAKGDAVHDGHKLSAMFGKTLKGLGKELGVAVTIRMMQRKGFRVSRSVDQKTGKTQVQCRRG